MACVCHSFAACQRDTPSSLASVIGQSNNDVISLRFLRSLRCVRCVGWKPRLSRRNVLRNEDRRHGHVHECQ